MSMDDYYKEQTKEAIRLTEVHWDLDNISMDNFHNIIDNCIAHNIPYRSIGELKQIMLKRNPSISNPLLNVNKTE